MVAYSLIFTAAWIPALQQADPAWLSGAPEAWRGLEQADAMSQAMGGFGWTMPVGVGLLVLLKLAPNIGNILQKEHQLSIEKRRQSLVQKGDSGEQETRKGG